MCRWRELLLLLANRFLVVSHLVTVLVSSMIVSPFVRVTLNTWSFSRDWRVGCVWICASCFAFRYPTLDFHSCVLHALSGFSSISAIILTIFLLSLLDIATWLTSSISSFLRLSLQTRMTASITLRSTTGAIQYVTSTWTYLEARHRQFQTTPVSCCKVFSRSHSRPFLKTDWRPSWFKPS